MNNSKICNCFAKGRKFVVIVETYNSLKNDDNINVELGRE
jgi:hypothetical protein